MMKGLVARSGLSLSRTPPHTQGQPHLLPEGPSVLNLAVMLPWEARSRTAGPRRPMSAGGLLRGPRAWRRSRAEDSARSSAWSDVRWGLRQAELPRPPGAPWLWVRETHTHMILGRAAQGIVRIPGQMCCRYFWKQPGFPGPWL